MIFLNRFLVMGVLCGLFTGFHFHLVFASDDERGWPPNCTEKLVRFHSVNPDLYRGGQPQDLEDLICLQSVGIKTVISLIIEEPKTIVWERAQTKALGMNFYSFPMSGIFSPRNSTVAKIFKELLEPNHFPVYIHCMHGKDRTGLIMGLYRVWLDGWTPKDAWEEMLQLEFDQRLLGLTHYFWNQSNKPMPVEKKR